MRTKVLTITEREPSSTFVSKRMPNARPSGAPTTARFQAATSIEARSAIALRKLTMVAIANIGPGSRSGSMTVKTGPAINAAPKPSVAWTPAPKVMTSKANKYSIIDTKLGPVSKCVRPFATQARTLVDVECGASNVILTGFMASGKSSAGRALALRCSMRFVDTDTLISDRYGAIEEIFKRDGEDAFRQMEREVATELATLSGLVIATGGRMMLDDHCAQGLGSKGRVFCLHASVEEIQRRYAADSQGPVRPLLASSEEDELLKLYAERSEAYSQFEQILTDGKSVDEVVEQIGSLLSDG